MSVDTDTEALYDELDALTEAHNEALWAAIKRCGCTILCRWTAEVRGHIRQHIIEARELSRN